MTLMHAVRRAVEEHLGHTVEDFAKLIDKNMIDMAVTEKDQSFFAGLASLLAIEIVERHLSAQERAAVALERLASTMDREINPGDGL